MDSLSWMDSFDSHPHAGPSQSTRCKGYRRIWICGAQPTLPEWVQVRSETPITWQAKLLAPTPLGKECGFGMSVES